MGDIHLVLVYQRSRLSLMICFLLLPLLINFVENCSRPKTQCELTGICANLYLYDANGKVLGVFEGSQKNILVRSVARLQIVGDYGCYIIFKKSNFRSSSFCWKGTDVWLPDIDYEYTMIRSVIYDAKCACQKYPNNENCKTEEVSTWSACSADCGPGTRSKRIKIKKQGHGGSFCYHNGYIVPYLHTYKNVHGPQETLQTEDCNMGKCPPPAWPNLRTDIGWGFSNEIDPRTEASAIDAGWKKIDDCRTGSKFLGRRYCRPDQPSLVLIYDVAGYIAGAQSVLLETDVDLSVYNITKQAVYVKDKWWKEKPAWFTTTYFVDPSIICRGGRTPAQWEKYGTGSQLLIQNGAIGNYIRIPHTQAQAEKSRFWFRHECVQGMGVHYLNYNYNPDQDCHSVLPFHIHYDQSDHPSSIHDKGTLIGFAWEHAANPKSWKVGEAGKRPDAIIQFVDRPPRCLYEIAESPGLYSMHFYFVDYPWSTQCPLIEYD